MTVNEIKQELDRAFGKYEFVADGHYYLCNGKRVGIGVTTFIGQFENEFDSDNIADKTFNKILRLRNEIIEKKEVKKKDYEFYLKYKDIIMQKSYNDVQYLLDKWDDKSKFSCEKGSTCHEFSQSLFSGEEWELLPFDGSKEYINAVDKIKGQAINFKKDYQDMLEHIKDEYIVGSEEFDIASAIDHLFYNKLTDKLVLVDYKTNSILKGYNDDGKNARYTKKMKVPLQKIDDLALYHYHIQLSIYKYLIEKYTDLTVDEWFIVYMSENNDNYEIIETPYLKDEVEKILEMRRVKNMNSVPVLIYGKSGTGKSTSLRNFKNEDIAIINVLGKPLPFRNVLKNIVTTDDYATVLENVKKTSRKIVVIDDAGYLITNQFMRTHSKGGGGNAVFAVYNELADNFWNLISEIKKIPGGKTVYFVMHEDVNEFGVYRPKTIGKLLDDKVCIEGMFTIAIRTMIEDNKYIFRLKNNGNDVTKTPFDMFDKDCMENDLKELDAVIKEYYGLNKIEDKKEEEEK